MTGLTRIRPRQTHGSVVRGATPPGLRLLAALALAGSVLVGCSNTPHGTTTSPSSASSVKAGTAHAQIGDLTLTGGYIPQPASPDVAAAYLTVANSGSATDTVTKVTTNVTRDVMAMTETTKGAVGTMTDVSSVKIPAHGSVSLTPGHAHLMLQDPNRALKRGSRVTMMITFAKAGTVTFTLPVVALTGPVGTPGNMSGMPGMG